MIGQDVTYGHEIFIMHYNSKKFLKGTRSTTGLRGNVYQFELSSKIEDGMIFQVLPRFKLRNRGESIAFNDQVFIMNQLLKSYINFYSNVPLKVDNFQFHDGSEESMNANRELETNEAGQVLLRRIKLPYKTPIYRNIDNKSQRFETAITPFPIQSFKLVFHSPA